MLSKYSHWQSPTEVEMRLRTRNTLEAFQDAIEVKYRRFETDVHLLFSRGSTRHLGVAV
jgi:glycerophosphoryl diester phosphodiesterase